MMPMNEAFVCEMDHRSVVVETWPDELACKTYYHSIGSDHDNHLTFILVFKVVKKLMNSL